MAVDIVGDLKKIQDIGQAKPDVQVPAGGYKVTVALLHHGIPANEYPIAVSYTHLTLPTILLV